MTGVRGIMGASDICFDHERVDGVPFIGSGQYFGGLVLWCWRRVINEICPDLCL
jgi:hypothetical protein